MCGILNDRECWVFIMQAIISLLAIGGCVIFIVNKQEIEWAKNILVMVVSVWFPSPAIHEKKVSQPTIIQNADSYQTLSAGSPIGRRWSVGPNVQGENEGRITSGQGDAKEPANDQE